MKLTQKQIDLINKNESLIFSTADKNGSPRAVIVIPSLVESDRIIISDVQMETSSKNVCENFRVFINSFDGVGTQIKISGIAKYETSGELFDDIRKIEAARNVAIRAIIPVQIEIITEVSED